MTDSQQVPESRPPHRTGDGRHLPCRHLRRISDARSMKLRRYDNEVRTMVRLDPEVAAAAEHLRRKRRIGLGKAVNELARAGWPGSRRPRTSSSGQRTSG